MKKAICWLAMILGVVISLLGVVFAALYVVKAIIMRIGDPDQSLIFWYLPILFIGIFGVMIGTRLLMWGVKRLRASRSTEKRCNAQHQ